MIIPVLIVTFILIKIWKCLYVYPSVFFPVCLLIHLYERVKVFIALKKLNEKLMIFSCFLNLKLRDYFCIDSYIYSTKIWEHLCVLLCLFLFVCQSKTLAIGQVERQNQYQNSHKILGSIHIENQTIMSVSNWESN